MKAYSDLYTWLEKVKSDYRAGKIQHGDTVTSPFGDHGVSEGGDPDYDDGLYITVGCCLPDGTFAEIEDGTYGQLQGFRIFKDAELD
jgi:hypothetical protein